MRVPLSWVREFVDLPSSATARQIGDALVRAGLEVETIEELDVEGPLVIGRVLAFADEPQTNGKTIRWCTVDVGPGNPPGEAGRGIVCGARNFALGDLVVVALPGCVLPGGFAIAARKTYGHVSDGMICSLKELGLGDDHTGIVVLTRGDLGGASVGDDARPVLGLPDAVLDIAVTPDRGYCLSIRGMAREAATAYGLPLRDPVVGWEQPESPGGPAVQIEDGADRIVLRALTGFSPDAVSPLKLRTRVALAGMRAISLAVDVTNYVMIETGQPLHAFDADRLSGGIVVRRAGPGEKLQTLDGELRALDPDDLVIADDSGPVALAGTMGGATTEVTTATTNIVIEAAHFDSVVVSREARRHKLSTEASRRFERGVDPALGPYASARALALLIEHGGGTPQGKAEVDRRPSTPTISLPVQHPSGVAGMTYPDEVVIARLRDVGCVVDGPDPDGLLTVLPPSWRPDLTDPNDLDEEVIRLEGYDRLPTTRPVVAARTGLRDGRRRQLTTIGRSLADDGWTEVRTYPFVGRPTMDALGLPEGDPRERLVRLTNPLSDEEPFLPTTLLPGLMGALRRNLGRGLGDVLLFEVAPVFLARPPRPVPRPPVTRRPTAEEIAGLEALLPDQPLHAAGICVGDAERPGWWGEGRRLIWADAVEAARTVAGALGIELRARAAHQPPWHPGRCAELSLATGEVVGWAGELHPRVLSALDLPPRSAAFELDLDVLRAADPGLVHASELRTYPLAKEDVAVVVADDVPAADVERALRDGAGDLLESIRLFDVYRDAARLGEGRKSLAYALRFRAPDRTLTVEETIAARDAAIAEAARRVGAVQRT
jgi:phenylalanyl-tRNA synthetase beta chain